MYCIRCGVELASTEKKCPLCNTVVCHPDFEQPAETPLYPGGKMPKDGSVSKVWNGVLMVLFLLPLSISFCADFTADRDLEWFGYVAGALLVAYVALALPLWFKKSNPVIFVPSSFVAMGLYLLYINLSTGGHWFLSFAFPVVGGLGLITCTVVTLLKYLRRGRLYVLGGALMGFGAFMLLVEYLLMITFHMPFMGWSLYPMVVFVLLGGLLIYLAIDSVAREMMERKLFF